jgi:hypothetical protein
MHVRMIAFSIRRSMKIPCHALNVRSHVGNKKKKSLDGKCGYKVPRKVLRYFPIKKRLQRLFVSALKLQVSLGDMMNTESKMNCLVIPPIPLCGWILMKNLPLIVVISTQHLLPPVSIRIGLRINVSYNICSCHGFRPNSSRW